jgi:hypothetical protein
MMIKTLNAAGFMSEIKKLNLLGKDFLEIIGNSKISNDIYNEIKENAGLTYERLVELLQSSALTGEDFARLLRDAQAVANLRMLERRQSSEQRLGQALGQAEERLEQQSKQPVQSAQPIKTIVPQEEAAYEPELKLPDDDGLFEDIIDDEPEESEEGVFVTAADNRGKINFCFCLAIMLACASFGLRWFYTGSFLVEKEQTYIYTVPETYRELAERLINAGDSPSVNEKPERTAETLLFNNKYIFNVIGNTLYVIEHNSGNMQKIAEIEYDGERILELHFSNDKLFVITEGEREGSFEHEEIIGDYYEPEVVLIAGSFTQNTVNVRVYDAWSFSVSPELSFTVDGELNTILPHRNTLVLAADYFPHEPRAYSDLNSFLPLFTFNGEKGFPGMAHIYAPPAALMNTEMTVLSMFRGAEAIGEFIVIGGAGSIHSGEDALFAAQVTADKSRIVRIDTFSESEPVFYDINGVITGVSERHSILHVEAQKGDKTELYVFNSALERLSGDFAAGEEPAAPVTEVLEIVIEEDSEGRREGIRLNMQKGEQVIATYLITADDSVSGIFTDAESDREAVFNCERTGIILIPVYYSINVADVEKLLIFNYDGAEFTLEHEIEYRYYHGGGNERRRGVIIDGFIYSFWDTTVVSASVLQNAVYMKMEL